MSRRWFLIVPLILVCFLLFQNLIVFKSVEWTMHKMLQETFCGELKWESIEHKGSTVLIRGPRVAQNDKINFLAETLTLHWDFQFFKRTLYLDVELEKPEWMFVCKSMDLAKEVPESGLLQWVKLQGALKINEGLVHLPSGLAEIDLDLKYHQQRELSFRLKQGSSQWDLSAHKEGEDTEGRIQVDQFPLTIISEFASVLSPSLKEGKTLKGNLDGHFAFRLSPYSRPQIEGNLLLEDFAINSFHGGYEMETPSLWVELKPAEPLAKSNILPWLPSLAGKIHLEKEGKVIWGKFSPRPFSAHSLSGDIAFSGDDKVDFDIKGIEEFLSNSGKLLVKGNFNYLRFDNMALDLNYLSERKDKDPTSLILKGEELGSLDGLVDLELKNFGIQQFSLLEAALHKLSPGTYPIDFREGRVDASVKASLNKSKISNLWIENIALRNLGCTSSMWECDFGAQVVSGYIKMDFEADRPNDSLNSELIVENGYLKLNTLLEDLWKFTDIQTKLVVKEGTIQKSVASVNLAGLQGKAEVDWLSKDQPLKMHLEGSGADLSRFVPPIIKAGIDKNALKDTLTIDLALNRENDEMKFKGDLLVKEDQVTRSTLFNFGFLLTPPLKDNQEHGRELLFGYRVAPDWLPDLFGSLDETPDSLANVLSPEIEDNGIFGYRLTDGWFESKNVALEKFVSPYLFRRGDTYLTGRADLKGNFDASGININYRAEDILIENDKVRMSMKETPGFKEGSFAATHTLDFVLGDHHGVLPLEQAIYLDKTKSLVFEDIRGETVFHNKKIFLPDLSAYINSVHIQGNVLVDNTDPRENAFDVYVNIPLIEGTLSDANPVLEKIDNEILLTKLPLEGQLHFHGEGAALAFHVLPDELVWDARVKGSISEGELNLGIPLLTSKGINLSFDYNKAKDHLLFNDLSGTFFLGENGEEEVHFIVDKLGFDSLTDKNGSFNLQLLDKKGELFSIKGGMKGIDDHVQFHFDKNKTHFGSLKPSKIHLQMGDLSRVRQFDLEIDLDVAVLRGELERIARSGLFLSSSLLSNLDGLSGKLASRFHFDENEGRFTFDMKGKDILLQDRKLSDVHLTGDVRDGVLHIKDALIDKVGFSLDLSKKKSRWILEHLGVNYADSLIVGLEGEWEEGSTSFEGRVNLLEVYLENLDQFDEMKPFIEEFSPKGRLKGAGLIGISKNEGKDEYGLHASFTTHFKGVELKGLQFADLEPSTLQFVLGRGVQFRNMKTALVDPESKKALVELFIEKIAIDFHNDTTEIENLKYSLPSKDLKWLSETLEKAFPDIVTPFVKDTITHLKTEGIVEGSIGLKVQNDQTEFSATLADGKWHLLDWDVEVRNFLLQIDPDEVKVSTQYLLENQLVWVLARTPRPDYQSGVVLIADGLSEEEPITAIWEKREGSGVVIKSLRGSSLGLNLSLQEDPANPSTLKSHNLTGHARFDLSRMKPLLSKEMAENIGLMGIGRGLEVHGDLKVQKDSVNDERPYEFKGILEGFHFPLKGFIFERLHSKIMATHESIIFESLVLEDPAGTISVEKGWMVKDAEKVWSIHVPMIAGYDIRPSLLWENDKPRSNDPKPLKIKELMVENLSGPLTPLSGITGTGHLSFVNPVKKNLHNTIFAIPAEILSRIGIDLIALTPVSGVVLFNIQDEKVYLTKFKDIYSDGKLSKFYLADSKQPSYMDFDGSLHLLVKMKQYTLLFKLAELFTFNIEGSLAKPVYSIQKGGKL